MKETENAIVTHESYPSWLHEYHRAFAMLVMHGVHRDVTIHSVHRLASQIATEIAFAVRVPQIVPGSYAEPGTYSS